MDNLGIFSPENCRNCKTVFGLKHDVPILAKPLRVIDGDTIVFAIKNPMVNSDSNELSEIYVRVGKIDTPEKNSKFRLEKFMAKVASVYTICYFVANGNPEKAKEIENELNAKNLKILKENSNVLIEYANPVYVVPQLCSEKNGKTTDSFGRIVANVFTDPQNPETSSLRNYLINDKKVARIFSINKKWTLDQLFTIHKNIFEG